MSAITQERSFCQSSKDKYLKEERHLHDGWNAYDGLLLDSYKHYRIYHHKNEFSRGKNHVNGIESFWSYTKRRLAKFNGLHESHFLTTFKGVTVEMEYESVRQKYIYHTLLETLRNEPL